MPVLIGGREALLRARDVELDALGLLLGMVLLGWGFNSARLRLLAGALGTGLSWGRSYGITVAGEFAGVATPAGAGNIATRLFLLSRRGLRLSDGAALVAVDHFMDLVFFVTAVPVALLVYVLEGGISDPARLAGMMIGLMLAGLALMVWLIRRYRPIALWVGRQMGRVARLRRWRYRLARGLVSFRRSVGLMLGMGLPRLVLLYLFCFGHWMLRYGILPVLLWSLGEGVPWGYLFVMQGLLLFLGQVTFLPGGGGGVELGFSALLAPYLEPSVAAMVLLVWRFCTFYWYLLAGAPVFVAMTGNMAGRLVAGRAG